MNMPDIKTGFFIGLGLLAAILAVGWIMKAVG